LQICGNGGSASLAEHFAQDLAKQCQVRSLPLTSLAMVTALANDISYQDIFCKQLEFYAKPEDLLIVISGSGNSLNILYALTKAKAMQIPTTGLLGFDGGKAKHLTDLAITVPALHMGRAEDGHLILSHILVYGLMEAEIAH